MIPRTFSLNCCLGLFNKLNQVKQIINSINPQIVFLQESEVKSEDRKESYKIKNYDFCCAEKTKTRIVAYVKSDIMPKIKVKYAEKVELIVVSGAEFQVIGFYRPFKLTKQVSHLNYIKDTIDF